MPRPQHPHCSTLAGRKVWAKPVEIPTVPAAATAIVSTQAQAQAAINDRSKRVIYVEGYIEGVSMSAGASSTDLRYLVFRQGGYPSSINFPYANNWRVTTEDPNYLIPWHIGSSYWTRVRFSNSRNCLLERIHYLGGQRFGGTLGLWDNLGSGESVDCGFQWVYHENDDTVIATRDFVLFGCLGYRPGHAFRSRGGFVYNCRSRNPGDFFQITNERPSAGWNEGVSHPSFHVAGIDCISDLYDANGKCVMHENLIDIKGGSNEDDNRIRFEDYRYYGARMGVHWPNKGPVNDPGIAGVLHIEQPHNVGFHRGVVWDCTGGWGLQPGYGAGRPTRNVHLNDNLIYDCGNVSGQAGYGILMSDDGAGGHEIKRNHIVKCTKSFAASDASGFTVEDNVISRSISAGWLADANSSNNLSDKSLAGASTVGAASREARTSNLTVEMPDPTNFTADTGVMVTLTDALLHPDDAPADFIWVTANEEEAGGTASTTDYITVTSVSGTAGAGLSSLGSTTDGFTDDSEQHRWSAEITGGSNPVIEWDFGGAYNVLSADIWWSWGAGRQSRYTLEAIDADGVAHVIVDDALSALSSGWQTVPVNQNNIVSMRLTGNGTEIDGTFYNQWTSINEVRFLSASTDSGNNTMITLDDRQVVLYPGNGSQNYILPASDEDGDTIAYSIHASDVYGGWDFAIGNLSVTDNVLTITPGTISGLAGFRLQANDGKGRPNSIASAEWEVIVEVGNQAPQWNLADEQMASGEVVYLDLHNVTNDFDGDSLIYSVERSSEILFAALQSDGHTLRVEALAEGEGSLTLGVTDGNHAPVLGRINYTIAPSGDTVLRECVVEGLTRG